MSINRVIDSIGNIDDDMVQEVERLRQKRKQPKPAWWKWSAIAACLCLVIGCVIALSTRQNRQESIQEQLLTAIRKGEENAAVDTILIERMLPVEDRVAVYEQIYVGSAAVTDTPESADSTEKLAPFVGEVYWQQEDNCWYRVKGMEEIKYLISEDITGILRLWEYRSFYVIPGGAEKEQETELVKNELYTLFPDANFTPYTYGDVYRMIYHVESAEDIVSITAAPSTSNNTNLGKKIQKEVGTHTYPERDVVEQFYACTIDAVCKGAGNWAEVYSDRDKYSYSFSTDAADKLTSGEETWANRCLTVTLRNGITIDSWKYSALNGIFFEYGGIVTEPLEAEEVSALNAIFGIK
ncbi:MAG: hypothetical protein IJY09_08980 [Lachnospiraceae bacterium]|nr:hypothetical protein [Lachnospiraceae bacterium]